jgi:hypothetical protein
MNEINDHKRHYRYRLYNMCERILYGIKTKIKIANICSVRNIEYSLSELNMHSCPLLRPSKATKVRKYITQNLQEEGFRVESIRKKNENDFWTIKISW